MKKPLAGRKQKPNLDSDTPQPVNIEYEIEVTPLALEMLTGVKDQRHQKSLSDRIDKLKTDPEKQGKPLIDQNARRKPQDATWG